MAFPNEFIFGASTASYQIEGAYQEDGKGLSIWDVFANTPGKIWSDQNANVACDHYHRWQEDIGLMKEIGLQAYRFSICWPRVLPNGTGAVNEKGMAFYDQLVDALLEAGVEPFVTLFHWDYPHELHKRGGWLNPDSPQWFADYASLLAERLGDRVTNWMTLNEPQVFMGLGYADPARRFPPAADMAPIDYLLAWHHHLLAHGRAVQALRAGCQKTIKVGPVPACAIFYPQEETEKDIEAAKARTFATKTKGLWQNAWLLDPIFFGRYPEDGLELFGKDVPHYTDAEMKIISEPVDFIGHNHYSGTEVHCDPDTGETIEKWQRGDLPQTAFRWPVTPDSMYWGTRFLHERYKCPIIITENGVSNIDWVSVDGQVHDPQRIDFLTRYLTALHRAVEDGVPVQGYLQWSLMDNFEWADGYKERFGLIHVDFGTCERTPKDSSRWYAELIRTRGQSIGL